MKVPRGLPPEDFALQYVVYCEQKGRAFKCPCLNRHQHMHVEEHIKRGGVVLHVFICKVIYVCMSASY